MSDQKVYIIVAIDKKRGMGYQGRLPWHLPQELQYFQETTTDTADRSKRNMVIMGRTSFEALPESRRPLPNRLNVILSRNFDYKVPGILVRRSLSEAIESADEDIETIYIIGGAKVCAAALQEGLVDGLYITHVDKEFLCDTFFPEIPAEFSQGKKLGEGEEQGIHYEFWRYEK